MEAFVEPEGDFPVGEGGVDPAGVAAAAVQLAVEVGRRLSGESLPAFAAGFIEQGFDCADDFPGMVR